jgi:hypothetical protein
MGTAKENAQIAKRRGTPTVAVGSTSHQFIRRNAKRVVRQHQQGHLGGNQPPGRLDSILERALMGVEVEDDNRTSFILDHASNSCLAGIEKELEFVSQSRRQQRLQGKVLRKEPNSDHFGRTPTVFSDSVGKVPPFATE